MSILYGVGWDSEVDQVYDQDSMDSYQQDHTELCFDREYRWMTIELCIFIFVLYESFFSLGFERTLVSDISTFFRDYLSGKRNRLWIFPYIASTEASLMWASVFCRNKPVPPCDEWIASKEFLLWENSRDFYELDQIREREKDFDTNNRSEVEDFYTSFDPQGQLGIQISLNDTIKIQDQWVQHIRKYFTEQQSKKHDDENFSLSNDDESFLLSDEELNFDSGSEFSSDDFGDIFDQSSSSLTSDCESVSDTPTEKEKENMERLFTESCWNVYETFTRPFIQQNFNTPFQRMRKTLKVAFFFDEYYEQDGFGDGVVQNGIDLFWKSIQRIGIFTPKSKKYASLSLYDTDDQIFEHYEVSPSDWKALGMIMNFCFHHEYVFQIYQPPVFFKFLLYGSRAKITPKDVAWVDRERMIHLLSLYFMTDDQLKTTMLSFEDLQFGNHHQVAGNELTNKNVYDYIYLASKKMVFEDYDNGYTKPPFSVKNTRFNNYDIYTLLDALCEGFHTTVPDYKPTEFILYDKYYPTELIRNEDVLSLIRIKCDKGKDFQNMDGFKHNLDCKNVNEADEHILLNGCLCPINLLSHYILNADYKTLLAFLEFTTGTTTFVTNGKYINDIRSEITVDLIPLGPKENFNLPTAQTCTRTLIINYYINEYPGNKNPFRSIASFSEIMDTCLQEGMQFWTA